LNVRMNIRMSQLIKRAVGLVWLLLCSECYAQSCALCYTQAASSGSRIIHGLRSGIFVLMVPPLFMSVGITLLAYRKRNQCCTSDEGDRREDW
jgi:hypothetical protein